MPLIVLYFLAAAVLAAVISALIPKKTITATYPIILRCFCFVTFGLLALLAILAAFYQQLSQVFGGMCVGIFLILLFAIVVLLIASILLLIKDVRASR